jgi:plasmid stability protein
MTLTIELPDDQEAALKAKAAAQGVSADQYARVVLEQDLRSPGKPRRHISEVIRENMRDVPPEIMAAMPKDGASQHDHYIYGWPKNQEGST